MLLWLFGGIAAVSVIMLLVATLDMGSLMGVGALDLAPSIDWRVLAFSAGVSLAVGLLSSIHPALRATRPEAIEALRASSAAATRRTPAGTSLAAFQLAASLTLLIGAYLLAGTLAHLSRVPLGFDPDDLFVFPVSPASVGYADAASLEYLNEFQRRLRQIPGVRAVTAADGGPFSGGLNMRRKVRAMDAAGAPPIEVRSSTLFSPSYFDTLGIPLIKGRGFTEADMAAGLRGDCRSVILSENLAQRLFGAVDPIGRVVEFPQGRAGERYEVIGIAGTARYSDLVTPPDEIQYEPTGPKSIGISSGATIIVRSGGSVALAQQAGAIAAALNPALPLTSVISMTDAVARARSDWDSLALIIGVLATLATVLACVGLYGVIAHGVAQRRREMGIRLALGATNAQVWRLVVRRAARITGAGVVGGLAGGYAFAQVLSTRLVGVDPLDPALWSLASVSLAAVAAVASIAPARAATRVDVADTLRAL
jgi:predicted permease